MSTEVLAIIISAVGVVVTLGTSMFVGAAWMVRRIDAVDEKLTARIDAVAADVTDLKISVARLEGPPRHLLTARR
ncbi:hypothetical protein ASD13_04795 [Microbacterium sp. Root1433D1]|uniref:hypothetical protein n=1 Tax=Microbacterium sp. Root1433D1 TaxID=1736463 RepID=UPI0006F8EC8E|nr:hypothetical protein [Microbacterium sp. Root1433D1]KQY77977.1 hypothetical protein ASD13_04795 [Microbacterium sp. Root1433D1]